MIGGKQLRRHSEACVARGPPRQLQTMASARFGVVSVGREAALALTGTNVWTFLAENADWLKQFKEIVLAEKQTEIAGVSAQHLSRLLSADGIAQLQEAAGVLMSYPSDMCATTYDQAARGSLPQACAFALDRLVTELSKCTFEDGGHLVQPRAPAGHCALCGLTMCCEVSGTPCYPSIPPPYDEASSEAGEGDEALGRLLLRSRVPPVGTPGWVLWRTQSPCGHMLHDHCSVKLFGARASAADTPTCPECGTSGAHVSPTWWYGISGTYPELGFATPPGAPELDSSRMAVLDPRSQAAIISWLPSQLVDELLLERMIALKRANPDMVITEMHAQLVAEGFTCSLSQVKKRQVKFRGLSITDATSDGSSSTGTNELCRIRGGHVMTRAEQDMSSLMDTATRLNLLEGGETPDVHGWQRADRSDAVQGWEQLLRGNLREAALIHARLSKVDASEVTEGDLSVSTQKLAALDRSHVLVCLYKQMHGVNMEPSPGDIEELDRQNPNMSL